MSDTQTESRCLAQNTPRHNNGSQCRFPAVIAGYCKVHARKRGITRLCLECGVWHLPGQHRKAGRNE